MAIHLVKNATVYGQVEGMHFSHTHLSYLENRQRVIMESAESSR